MWEAHFDLADGIQLFDFSANEILRKRGEQASQESLHAIAEQAAARIATYIAQQREMLRAIATAIGGEPDAPQRVRDISLDAPSLGKLRLVTAETPPRDLPPMLKPFHSRFPHVDLVVETGHSRALLDGVEPGVIDLAVLVSEDLLSDRNVVLRRS